MRESVVRLSVIIQTLSAVAARPIITSPEPIASVAVTLKVLGSTRVTVRDSQFGTHKEPNATIVPEHGFLRPATGSRGLFVLGSMRIRLSFVLLSTRTESAMAIQPGPSTGISASDFKLAAGICTPGVLIPTLGAAEAAFAASSLAFLVAAGSTSGTAAI